MSRLPNPRVQRTRSAPSAPHEPLTRHPLGGWWRVGALMCASIFLAGFVARSPVAAQKKGWLTYRNPALGLSLLYPSSMILGTADLSSYGVLGWPKEAVTISIPESELEGSTIVRAFVAIGTEGDEWCHPGSALSEVGASSLTVAVGNRRFYSFYSGDAWTSNSIVADILTTPLTSGCFVIMAVVEEHRGVDHDKAGDERGRRVKPKLMQVIRSLTLENRSAESSK